jgi:hypothetical protein
MRRWIIRTGAAALVLTIAAALAVWLTLRASLPQLDGELTVPGLGGMATIDRRFPRARVPILLMRRGLRTDRTGSSRWT